MKLTAAQIADIQRDCEARARARALEPRLQHARKQLYRRSRKPIAKHGAETMRKAGG